MNTKTLFWTLGGVATIVGGYFIYKRITQPVEFIGEKPKSNGSKPPKTTTTTTTTTTTSNSGLPLKRGSKGEKVKQVQRFLISNGYDLGTFGVLKDGVDGDCGSKTEQAVSDNQKPFATFKSMYPSAVQGQVSVDFFNTNIKGQY